MHNGTCCALKSHAKSRYNRKIICGKAVPYLVERCNRNQVRRLCGCKQRFSVLPSMITAHISAIRHYAVRPR